MKRVIVYQRASIASKDVGHRLTVEGGLQAPIATATLFKGQGRASILSKKLRPNKPVILLC